MFFRIRSVFGHLRVLDGGDVLHSKMSIFHCDWGLDFIRTVRWGVCSVLAVGGL